MIGEGFNYALVGYAPDKLGLDGKTPLKHGEWRVEVSDGEVPDYKIKYLEAFEKYYDDPRFLIPGKFDPGEDALKSFLVKKLGLKVGEDYDMPWEYIEKFDYFLHDISTKEKELKENPIQKAQSDLTKDKKEKTILSQQSQSSLKKIKEDLKGLYSNLMESLASGKIF